MLLLAEKLEAEGIRSPVRSTSTGRTFGGVPFSRGQLYKILGNPIYAGDIPHQRKVYKDQHRPIIERQTWERVQSRPAENTQGAERIRVAHPTLPAGLVSDGKSA